MSAAAAMLVRVLLKLRRWRSARTWERAWARGERCWPSWRLDGPRPPVLQALREGWLRPPGLLLELGCGVGHDASVLADAGFDVVGLDLSGAAIAQARARYGERPRLSFGVGDACSELGVNGPFDVVVDLGCLHGIGPVGRRGYAANVARASAAGSRMLLLMNAVGSTPEGRLGEVEALLCPPFVVTSWDVADHERPGAPERISGPVFRMLRS